MGQPGTLLAKTPTNPGEEKATETLLGHTSEVIESVQAILAEMTNRGVGTDVGALEQLVTLGAIFHDLGKATNVFQSRLRSEKHLWNKKDPVLHEILSGLLLQGLGSPIEKWLQHCVDISAGITWKLAWIVGGHHLRMVAPGPTQVQIDSPMVRIEGIPDNFVFFADHPDVAGILKLAAKALGETPPDLGSPMPLRITDSEKGTGDCLEWVVEDFVFDSQEKSAKLSEEDRREIAIAKAILVSGDVAASAVNREGKPASRWVRTALHEVVREKDLSQIIQGRIGQSNLLPFQQSMERHGAQTTLVEAGCGNGKTIGAYAWARRHAAGKKLFFCYPTTGTSSAGFEDYLLAQTDIERNLIHSRAQVDLERMMESEHEDPARSQQKLRTLSMWQQQVVACTVDTVLSLVQNGRKGLFGFPAIMNSAIVFDEIHSYDAKLFGALMRFLGAFPHIPVLLMTASLPRSRLKQLRACLCRRLGDPISGDPELQGASRYRLSWKDETAECRAGVRDALFDGKRILWVCNTVGDAVETAKDLSRHRPIVYHSRFRYRDRVQRQEEVLEAFRRDGPCLVISTQVCEMSLDISADLMISALCPLPALIQRLGRLNRPYGSGGGTDGPAPCVVHDFDCAEGRPYSGKDLQRCAENIREVLGEPLSQNDLSAMLRAVQQNEEISTYSAWLDDAWQSSRRPLRKSSPSVTILREQDLAAINAELDGKKATAQNLAAWTIPMWYNPRADLSARFGPYPVASDSDVEYDRRFGARWKV